MDVRYLGCFLLASLGFCANPAWAVVVNVGDGDVNTQAPLDDPGFSNVGFRGAGTGIYLGNRWVLTANHLGAGPIAFGDQVFTHVPGETHRLQNPGGRGLSLDTDLLLMRLSEEPDLPGLRLGCRQVPFGAEVMLIGAGRDRQAELSAWDVQRGPGSSDDVWTLVTNDSLADQLGFQTESTRSIRWGNAPAVITNREIPTAENGDVISIHALFDQFDPGHPILGTYADIMNVSRAVTGDSGGPVFWKNGGFWELAGMIHGVSRSEENQPGGPTTALFGTWTYAADLFAYRDQLKATAVFGPAPGDFDNDGKITAADIDRLFAAVSTGENNCHFDLTEDGTVARADVNVLLELAKTLPGDADLDGAIGFLDFLLLSKYFGQTDVGWGQGDFDGDDEVTFGDFIFLSNGFGTRFGDNADNASSLLAVPEPWFFKWYLFGLVVACLRFRKSFQ